ncbi:unnamed protein product, partial [Symbiodinium sp. KB8]
LIPVGGRGRVRSPLPRVRSCQRPRQRPRPEVKKMPRRPNEEQDESHEKVRIKREEESVEKKVQVKRMPRKPIKEEKASLSPVRKRAPLQRRPVQVKRMPRKPAPTEEMQEALEKEASAALKAVEVADELVEQYKKELNSARLAAEGNQQDLLVRVAQQAYDLAMKDKQRSASSLQEIMEKLKQAKQQALKTEGETDPPTVPVKEEIPDHIRGRLEPQLSRRVILKARKRLRMYSDDELSADASSKRRRRASPERCCARQIYLLREAQRSANDWDPSYHNADKVFKKWGHLLRLESPDRLIFTHHQVSKVFRNGPHKGQPLQRLLSDLEGGILEAQHLTALVGVQQDGKLHVMCGNRRLTVLKQYMRNLREVGDENTADSLRVHVYVHRFEDMPKGIQAKFIEASSTVDGAQPGFFPPRDSPRVVLPRRSGGDQVVNAGARGPGGKGDRVGKGDPCKRVGKGSSGSVAGSPSPSPHGSVGARFSVPATPAAQGATSRFATTEGKEEKEEEDEESELPGSQMKFFEGTWQDRAGCIYRILQTSAPWRSQGHYIVEKYSYDTAGRPVRANYCLSLKDGRVWWGIQRYWARWDGDFICWYDSHQRDSLAFSWKRVADLQGTLQFQ